MIPAAPVTLNDSREMPQLGLGVWQTPNDQAAVVVGSALAAGYRLVDTAALYGNERGVGLGVRESGVPRADLFVTTKLWNDRQGHASALQAFERSLDRLGLDYVDLYLIHWPAPARGLYLETWRALAELQADGRARSIGVSNFGADELRRLIDETGMTPAINQIELHPRFQQKALRNFHQTQGIATQSWSPLGQGLLLDDPVIARIAARHARTPAQVILRWHLDLGLAAIPKSASPGRIRENFAVFDFALDPDDLAAIDALDDPHGRIGPDPRVFS